jgi:prepilin-type N-terminal cleavage/methylation domain-containing protein
MNPSRARAFTLVEMLVVIALIGVLIAMLMPAMATARDTFYSTQCMKNLRTIFDAQNTWRSDNNTEQFATGPFWTDQVQTYMENRNEALMCPNGPNLVGSDPSRLRSCLRIPDIAFAIYGGGDAGKNNLKGNLDHIITLSPDMNESSKYWTTKTQRGPNTWFWGIEDGGWNSDPDIWCEITTDNYGNVTRFRVLNKPDEPSGYRYGLMLRGQLVRGLEWYKDTAVQDVNVDISEYGWAYSDYGMSRGAYENHYGSAQRPDPKLFFILDYPKSVADYAQIGGGGVNNEEDAGPDFFILDPENWSPPPRF